MSLFDDDFYSTRVKRRVRRQGQTGFGIRLLARSRGGFLQSSTLKVALASSLASSLLVAIVFTWFIRADEPRPAAVPALAGGQPVVDTAERIVSAAAKVRPAVVSVINRTAPAGGADAEEPDASGDAGDDESAWLENASLGSGVIFDKKGGKAWIVTNAHVIQDAAQVEVVLVNGDKKEAKIVGKDTISDLAVLQVDADGIDTVAKLGDSDKLQVGQTVIAIGNPLGFGDTLTAGIVSSTHRVIPVSLNQDGVYDWEQEVIQTDAAINQGNSGGALVDLNGEVVGINSMKVADMGVEGLGFALPMHEAKPIIEALLKYGKVARPYIGVYTMDLSLYLDGRAQPGTQDGAKGRDGAGEAPKGKGGSADADGGGAPLVVPKGVKKGVIVLEAVGPAKEAGLQFNDLIVKLDDTPIGSTLELRKYLYDHKKIGDTLKVSFYRDGHPQTVSLKLVEKEDDNG